MILRGEQSPQWTMTDRVLAIAVVLAEDMRCPGCGHPKHEAWNPDSAGWYEVREAECQGCGVIERAAEADKKPRGDLKRWTEDMRPPDRELMAWQPGGRISSQPAPQQPRISERAVG